MKGNFNNECNRTACKVSPATYYNHSTRKYYCKACADLINDENRSDSIRLFGHDLCTPCVPESNQEVGDTTSAFLRQIAKEKSIPIDRLMTGILNGDLYVWDYDSGRSQSEQFRVVLITPTTNNNQ